MIRAIIIDDESRARSALEQEITLNCPEVMIVGEADSVQSSVELIKKVVPELIFLDIQLSDGLGFHILEKVGNEDYQIIFTTAYSEYAIKAFKTNAIDYLLKPIDVDELINAVNNAEKRISSSTKNSNAAIESLILSAIQKSKKISIPSQEGILWVDLDDIIRLEAESNYTHVYLKGRKKMMIAKTLKSFEDQLSNTMFCRIHSAHLINLNEIEKYIKGDGGIVVLKDGANIPVSRANKAELLTKLNLYL